MQALAKQVRAGPSRAISLDVRDHNAVVAAMVATTRRGGPAVLPFEERLAKAAIEAKVPYVSICDDHDAAQAVFVLDQQAKERGCHDPHPGAGWTPGSRTSWPRRASRCSTGRAG